MLFSLFAWRLLDSNARTAQHNNLFFVFTESTTQEPFFCNSKAELLMYKYSSCSHISMYYTSTAAVYLLSAPDRSSRVLLRWCCVDRTCFNVRQPANVGCFRLSIDGLADVVTRNPPRPRCRASGCRRPLESGLTGVEEWATATSGLFVFTSALYHRSYV